MNLQLQKEWNQNKNNNIFWNYIYKLTLSDGSTYIGLRHSFIEPEKDTEYLGSGSYVDKSKIISKEILIQGQFSDKELSDLETFYIKKDKQENPLNLNFTLGAGAWNVYNYSKLHSDEIINILKQKAKERWDNPEVRVKLEYKRKIQNTPEVKDKIAKTVHSTCDDPEWKEQHSQKIKKALSTPERKAKMRQIYDSRKGKPCSNYDEWLANKKLYDVLVKEVYNEYKNELINYNIPWNKFVSIIKGCRNNKQLMIEKIVSYLNNIKEN